MINLGFLLRYFVNWAPGADDCQDVAVNSCRLLRTSCWCTACQTLNQRQRRHSKCIICFAQLETPMKVTDVDCNGAELW